MCAIDASLKGFFQAWGNPLIGIFVVRRKRLKGENEVRIVRRDGARRKKLRNPETLFAAASRARHNSPRRQPRARLAKGTV